jgi:hypothetical protein
MLKKGIASIIEKINYLKKVRKEKGDVLSGEIAKH